MDMKKCAAGVVCAALVLSGAGELCAETPRPYCIGDVKIIRATDIGAAEVTLDKYMIDIGDSLEISVWQVDELKKTVVVRPDGKISFPLIGDVQASGNTINDLSTEIAVKLRTYIKNPQVTVIVTTFGGKKVIVLGDISSAGVIRFSEPVRILEILALSGGYSESAGLKSVLIIRGDLKTQTKVIVVNIVNILKGQLNENVYVQKNDIIYVPKSFIGNVAYFLRQIAPLISAAQTFYQVQTLGFDIKNQTYKQDYEDTRGR